MTVNNVDLVEQPNASVLGFITPPSDAKCRLTFQHFNLCDPVTAFLAPHNSDARISNSAEWPPPVTFDTAYGCVALKKWGVASFIDFARGRTRDVYYTNGDGGDDENGDDDGVRRRRRDGADGVGGKDRNGGSRGDGAKLSQQKRNRSFWAVRRQEKRCTQQEGPQEPDFADMILALWMQNSMKRRRQAHATRVDRTREKVQTWLDSAE